MLPQRVIVISLPRRNDRLIAFMDRWITDGACDIELSVSAGIEAATGAEGCHKAHIAALSTGDTPVLVLEDDAAFCTDFGAKLAALTLPADWELCYLGGEHLAPPMPVYPGLVRPTRIRRSHAYIVREPRALARLLPGKGHVDGAIDALPLMTYAVAPFWVGQAGGPSDVTSAVHGLRFFND